MTNRQIAEAMFLAEKTVKNYVSSLLAKLGLQRRTQAALVLRQAPGRCPEPATPTRTSGTTGGPALSGCARVVICLHLQVI